MNTCDNDDDYDWWTSEEEDDRCDYCKGEGKVTTEDYESYLGASYKTCPWCGGMPGDGPLS